MILRVHPSVSPVVEKTKNIDLGTSDNFKPPLASSTISESDTVVRVTDGDIVAIGGLMRESTQRNRSGVPGLSRLPLLGGWCRANGNAALKSELVILIKTTLINPLRSPLPKRIAVRQRLLRAELDHLCAVKVRAGCGQRSSR